MDILAAFLCQSECFSASHCCAMQCSDDDIANDSVLSNAIQCNAQMMTLRMIQCCPMLCNTTLGWWYCEWFNVIQCCVMQCLDDDIANDSTHQINDADEEDDGEREAKWRTERLEREKFLEEHKVDACRYFLVSCYGWYSMMVCYSLTFGKIESVLMPLFERQLVTNSKYTLCRNVISPTPVQLSIVLLRPWE